MKRTLALLLALALLLTTLSGCALFSKRDSEETTTPTEAPETTSAPDGKPLYFELSELPAIGDYVSDDKQAYFFKDGAHDAFETRDDYGGILPYFADIQMYLEVPSYTWENPDTGKTETEIVEHRTQEYLYSCGLATTDGRIITKGVYDYAEVFKNPDGSGYYVFTKNDEEDSMLVNYQDIVGLDGSWAVRCKDWSFRAVTDSTEPYTPYFTCVVDDRVLLFNCKGEKLLDLTQYSEKTEYGDYSICYIAYSDRDYILIETGQKETLLHDDEFDEEYSGIRATYTLFDNSGKATTTFSLDDAELSCLKKGLLCARRQNSGSMQILDLKGNPAVDQTFAYQLTYDPTTKLIVAMQDDWDVDANEFVMYFNEDLERVSPSQFSWDMDLLFNYIDWEFYSFENGSVLFVPSLTDPKVLNIFGQEVSFEGVNPSEIAYLDLEHGDNGNGYFILETKDGTIALFSPDGTRLFEMEPPERDINEEYNEVSYSCYFEKGNLCVTTKDDTRILYNIETGEEVFRLSKKEFSKQPANRDFYWDMLSDKYLRLVTYNPDEMDDYDSNEETTLYQLPEMKPLYHNILWAEQIGDYLLILLASHSIVLDQDGNTVLKIENSDLV